VLLNPKKLGFLQVNQGLVQFHRDAKGRRECKVGAIDSIKIIGRVDYILIQIESAKKRS
jgi:hypothetical protein